MPIIAIISNMGLAASGESVKVCDNAGLEAEAPLNLPHAAAPHNLLHAEAPRNLMHAEAPKD